MENKYLNIVSGKKREISYVAIHIKTESPLKIQIIVPKYSKMLSFRL